MPDRRRKMLRSALVALDFVLYDVERAKQCIDTPIAHGLTISDLAQARRDLRVEYNTEDS